MPESFVRWLHRVCIEDSDRKQPYSDVYSLGPQIETCLGIDGDFNLPRLSIMFREKFSETVAAKHLDTVVVAEAAWRLEVAGMPPASAPAPETCTHTGLDGRPCRNPPVPGAARCSDHGGAVLDAAIRRSMLITAYSKLVDSADVAVEALVDIAENSNSALARVYASREILDRIGIVHEDGAHQNEEADLTGESQEELMNSLHEQLEAARGRLELQAIPIAETDSEVVDGEIVED